MTNHPTIAWSLRDRQNGKNLFVHQVVRQLQLQLRDLLRTCPHWKVKRAMMHPRWKKLIRYSAVCCSWPCIQVHIHITLEWFFAQIYQYASRRRSHLQQDLVPWNKMLLLEIKRRLVNWFLAFWFLTRGARFRSLRFFRLSVNQL